MKTLHKLFTGMIFVALTAFGLTALTSSSSDSVVPVLAFLDETCSSDVYMEHESIQDMLEFKGTERDGIVWDFESYNHIEDLQTQLYPECYLVADLLREPEIVVRGTPWPARPSDPFGAQGRGGGGGGGGQHPAPNPPGTETSTFEFTDEELKALNDCWQKLAKAKLSSLTGDSAYEAVSGYDWASSDQTEELVGMGATVHNPKNGSPFVRIYPSIIQSWKPAGTLSKHVIRQVVLHEYIHTMQGQRAKAADENWENFKPYEWYDNEVQAWNLSRSWYYKLYGVWSPLAGLTETEMDFSSEQDFLDKKQAYQDIEDKISKGLSYDEDEKLELENWFKSTLPNFRGRGGGYQTTDELEC
ncbi:MAG: hypothetical protein F4Z01_01665 [Gammaproteobacteria bacterium]|nr:hypothetical protein [Gammaproteobacteria bacterium]MYF37847.1 hypothetical protein [Gammaproteobacteria bacterium]